MTASAAATRLSSSTAAWPFPVRTSSASTSSSPTSPILLREPVRWFRASSSPTATKTTSAPLPFCSQNCNVPVYGTRLTIGFTNGKLKRAQAPRQGQTARLSTPSDAVEVGIFRDRAVPRRHSIPDAVGFAIHTPGRHRLSTPATSSSTRPRSTASSSTSPAWPSSGRRASSSCSPTAPMSSGRLCPLRAHRRRRLRRRSSARRQRRVIMACFASNVHRVQQAVDMAVRLRAARSR